MSNVLRYINETLQDGRDADNGFGCEFFHIPHADERVGGFFPRQCMDGKRVLHLL